MRKKIQSSMTLVLTITLLISYALMTIVLYKQTIRIMEDEIKQEADYIKTAIEITGDSYLEEMDKVRENTRVTLVEPGGDVLYDSKEDEVTLENHSNRPEIITALENGVGQNIRKSDTIGKNMFYYAVQLEEGNILRVSKTIDTAFYSALQVLPIMITIGFLMMVFAWMLSKWQVLKLIKPINELDLDHPLENEMYEELTPLLESMEKQNKEKEAVANIRKEFSANVSHELKTPLTSISGYAEIMKNGMVKPDDMKVFSERIFDEASRLIVLIEDIIKLSRLDEGSIEIQKEDVDLFFMTREICSRLSLTAAEKKVRFEVTGESVVYSGIKQILDEMIYNICENAVKYNKPGGMVSVWVGNTLKGKKVIVTDTGIGIPEDQKERVFERFYRVDKSHSRDSGGTGLGLSIVKHGAMLHHAEIFVESELNKGTKIEMTFRN